MFVVNKPLDLQCFSYSFIGSMFMQLVEFFDFFLIQFSIFPQTVNLLLGLFGEIVRNSLFQFCQSFRTIYKRHHVEHL